MRGFTFSQLAVILLVLIGLAGFIALSAVMLSDYASSIGSVSTGAEGNKIGNLIGSCAAVGGECLNGCIGREDLGPDKCTGEFEGMRCCL